MSVLVAKRAGFCFGVKRVIELAEETLRDASAEGWNLYGLGWPVHNEVAVARLEAQGLRLVGSLADIPVGEKARLLLRAHGEPLDVITAAQERDLILVDAICPLVKRVREAAFSAAEMGRAVVCVGDGQHPEVRGILSCVLGANRRAFVAGQELPAWPADTPMTVVPQTTVTAQTFHGAVAVLREHFEDLEVLELRCNAVDIRQKEALALAARVDYLVVVGSERSANTRHLLELVAGQVPALRIAHAGELGALPAGVTTVGLTAGASTPADVIEAVRVALVRLVGEDEP